MQSEIRSQIYPVVEQNALNAPHRDVDTKKTRTCFSRAQVVNLERISLFLNLFYYLIYKKTFFHNL